MAAKQRPFAGVDWAVIDSPAFADLTGEEVRLLLILSRQFDGHNNGRMQATHAYCKFKGINSEATLNRAIKSLVAHGFVYKTRSHGLDSATGKHKPALYALTWLKLTQRKDGLFCNGFKFNAYESWSSEKNTPPKNCSNTPPKNEVLKEEEPAERILQKMKPSDKQRFSEDDHKTSFSVAYEHVPVYVPKRNEPAKIIRLGIYRETMSVKCSGYKNEVTHRTTSSSLSRIA